VQLILIRFLVEPPSLIQVVCDIASFLVDHRGRTPDTADHQDSAGLLGNDENIPLLEGDIIGCALHGVGHIQLDH
jgi:hypothetical protein